MPLFTKINILLIFFLYIYYIKNFLKNQGKDVVTRSVDRINGLGPLDAFTFKKIDFKSIAYTNSAKNANVRYVGLEPTLSVKKELLYASKYIIRKEHSV